MKYVVVGQDGPRNELDPSPYLEALPTLLAELPPGARAFASAPQHYDFSSQWCIKDLQLRQLACLRDQAGPAVEAVFDWRHYSRDDGLRIQYGGVTELVLHPGTTWDDILADEILPDRGGCTHELAMVGGARLFVRCADLSASWYSEDAAR